MSEEVNIYANPLTAIRSGVQSAVKEIIADAVCVCGIPMRNRKCVIALTHLQYFSASLKCTLAHSRALNRPLVYWTVIITREQIWWISPSLLAALEGSAIFPTPFPFYDKRIVFSICALFASLRAKMIYHSRREILWFPRTDTLSFRVSFLRIMTCN